MVGLADNAETREWLISRWNTEFEWIDFRQTVLRYIEEKKLLLDLPEAKECTVGEQWYIDLRGFDFSNLKIENVNMMASNFHYAKKKGTPKNKFD